MFNQSINVKQSFCAVVSLFMTLIKFCRSKTKTKQLCWPLRSFSHSLNKNWKKFFQNVLQMQKFIGSKKKIWTVEHSNLFIQELQESSMTWNWVIWHMSVEEPWRRLLLEVVSYIKKNQLNLPNGLKKFLNELLNVLKIIEIDFIIKHFYSSLIN